VARIVKTEKCIQSSGEESSCKTSSWRAVWGREETIKLILEN
jgi:hypothetical protein